MKKIAVLTTSRSDFGLQTGVIEAFAKDPAVSVEVVATGTHFLDSSRGSLQEVERFCDTKGMKLVKLSLGGAPDSRPADKSFFGSQVRMLSEMMHQAEEYIDTTPLDAVVFLGDRWELAGFVYAAFLKQIPLVHISGGETTEGALDDVIRHSLTKLSSIHLVAAEEYGRTISRMGEEDWRIALCGEPGLDWLHHSRPRPRSEVCESLRIDATKAFVLLALHPATLETATQLEANLEQLEKAIASLPGFLFVMTAPNSEPGSENIVKWGRAQELLHKNFVYFESLGRELFVEALSHSLVLVGNSSSGIVEAPSVGTPSINLGSRQKGRLRAESVVDLGYDAEVLIDVISSLADNPMQQRPENPYDPFADGNNSRRAAKAVVSLLFQRSHSDLISKKLVFSLRQQDWITP